MPKQPNRRLVTGNRRRLPVRRMSHNRRHMALSHEQVGFMMMLQQQILGNWFLFITSISPLHLSACAYMFAKSNPELFLNVAGNVDLIFTGLAGVNMANFVYHISQFYSCYHLDYLLHDITPQEEASYVGFVPRNNIRLLSWSDQECNQKLDLTNANSIEYTDVLDCKQSLIIMMVLFVCTRGRSIVVVPPVTTYLTQKRSSYTL